MRWTVLARALAAALLDGEWSKDAMLARAREAIGARPRWLPPLVKRVLAHFPEPPRARHGALVALIAARPSIRRAARGARLERMFLPAPAMGAMRWPVLRIETLGELAAWLGEPLEDLLWLADRRAFLVRGARSPLQHYTYRWLPKASGGARLLERPKPRLKRAQRRILHEILDRVPPHEAAHGFRAGRSVCTFAAPHVGKAQVVRMDLADFFASVRGARVRALFAALGYPDEVAATLAALCTTRVPIEVLAAVPRGPELRALDLAFLTRQRLAGPHLPQGAPTSPALANLCVFPFDLRIAALATRSGSEYTRYADDLAFSGPRRSKSATDRFTTQVAAIAFEEGFAVNFRKTRVLPASARQEVAGVVVNERLGLGRDEIDRLRAILHNCATKGPATQTSEPLDRFRAHLTGRVAWVAHVHPGRGERLRRTLDRIAWP